MSNVLAFIIMAFIPIIVINFFWVKSQKQFIELYKKRLKPSFPIDPDGLLKYLFENPRGFVKKIPWILFGRLKLIWQKYDDPQLDKAAGKVRRYFWVILAILIFNFFFQLFFFIL